jgi:3D (Asp-Asp-Asp) domain-containing protein
MNKTLKNVGLFLGISALTTLFYPHFANGIIIAQATAIPAETTAEIVLNSDGGDEKNSPTKPNESSKSSENKAETATAKNNELKELKTAGAAVSYSATAYALRGRTATGEGVRRGIIAADPRHLPLGTRVQIQAQSWSGTYVVADTGSAIRGRRIDVWVPSNGEARRFGRRTVKLTVLQKAR